MSANIICLLLACLRAPRPVVMVPDLVCTLGSLGCFKDSATWVLLPRESDLIGLGHDPGIGVFESSRQSWECKMGQPFWKAVDHSLKS